MTRRSTTGFTLVEMVTVIVITGIISGMVVTFIKPAVDSYFSAISRAVLADEADTALHFMGRDMRTALPNSMTCAADGSTAQFLQIRSGGRYREAPTSASSGVPLSFGASASSFDMIGASATSASKDAFGNSVTGSSSRVVVGNLTSGVASCNSSYSAFSSNAGTLSAVGASSVTLSSAYSYPLACDLESATTQDNGATTNNEINEREFGKFYVVNSTAILYACDTTNGLTRNGVSIIDASHVSSCFISCDAATNNLQLVTLNLSLKDKNGETITLLRRLAPFNRL